MGTKIRSFDIAVMNKVNELAARYGLELWDFDAEIDTSTGDLSFPSAPIGFEKNAQFDKMIAALGCKGNTLVHESDSGLIENLDRALRLAPRARSL